MFNDDEGLYSIGTVSKLVNEHAETLRIWEKNNLLFPNRNGYQRKYSNDDIKRIHYIKHLIHDKGLNIAGVRELISLYPCWNKKNCKGGLSNNTTTAINGNKPCWKLENTFCMIIDDKADLCSSCSLLKDCKECKLNK